MVPHINCNKPLSPRRTDAEAHVVHDNRILKQELVLANEKLQQAQVDAVELRQQMAELQVGQQKQLKLKNCVKKNFDTNIVAGDGILLVLLLRQAQLLCSVTSNNKDDINLLRLQLSEQQQVGKKNAMVLPTLIVL